jgi:hypothetical protein
MEALFVPGPETDCQLMDEQAVIRVLQSFPVGSSGGPDCLHPQHLLDLVTCRESGSNLLASLTGFVNMVLSGFMSISDYSSVLWCMTYCTQ